jgi:hypothetical protein
MEMDQDEEGEEWLLSESDLNNAKAFFGIPSILLMIHPAASCESQ